MSNPLTLIPAAAQNGAKPDAPRKTDGETKAGFTFEEALKEEARQRQPDQEAALLEADTPSEVAVAETMGPEHPPKQGDTRDTAIGEQQPAPETLSEARLMQPEHRSESVAVASRAPANTGFAPDRPADVAKTESSNRPALHGTSQSLAPPPTKLDQSVRKAVEPAVPPARDTVSVMEAISRHLQKDHVPETTIRTRSEAPRLPSEQLAPPAPVHNSQQGTAPMTKSPEDQILTAVEPDAHDLPALRDAASAQGARDSNTIPSAQPARPETARAIASQMAAVISAKPGAGGVEIALNPEELGRVSITLSGRDDGLHLMIVAERPETLDLLRRHIAILSAEFEELGYGGLSLDLGASTDHHSSAEQQDDGLSTFNPEDTAAGAETTARAMPNIADRGLDMRL